MSFMCRMFSGLLFLSFSFLASTFSLSAQSSTAEPSQEVLIVGTKDAPPFSMKGTDGEWEGISIDLWKDVAEEINLKYELRETDLHGLIQGVADDSLDVAVAALTITADREKVLDFSHPYYQTGLGIAVRAGGSGGIFVVLKRLISLDFLSVIGGLLLVLLLVGFFIWLVERKKNPEQFGGGVAKGIGSGFWWSAVTMTTVGYGDKAPVTFVGRMIGLIWMFVAIIIISSFTAAIAASLTVSELETDVKGVGDLPRVRVGGVSEAIGAEYLREQNISFRPYATVEEGMEALREKEIDAFVHDAPLLRYLSSSDPDGVVQVLPETFHKQFYAIALPNGSPWREAINRALLKRMHDPEWTAILARYIGNDL
ncbi:MAG: transporter substrate-binding domain-containing protein [Ignavibacteriae bacterium]|nr:transporter substrate-binding domain-containing protein [Ignavibacteriota bacterium]MCB9216751.1 transporter substrate-binding domain-containing protein [Ignavibacteria bacterium]